MLIALSLLLVFPLCMLWAAVSDLVSMTIANRVSLVLVGAFAVAAPLAGMDWALYGWHFAAGAIVLLVTFGLFSLGAIGGGDAKLLAATALWFGFDTALMDYLLYASVIGGILTLALMVLRSLPIAAKAGNHALLRHCADKSAGIPYGIALGLAGLLVFPQADIAQWALARLGGH